MTPQLKLCIDYKYCTSFMQPGMYKTYCSKYSRIINSHMRDARVYALLNRYNRRAREFNACERMLFDRIHTAYTYTLRCIAMPTSRIYNADHFAESRGTIHRGFGVEQHYMLVVYEEMLGKIADALQHLVK